MILSVFPRVEYGLKVVAAQPIENSDAANLRVRVTADPEDRPIRVFSKAAHRVNGQSEAEIVIPCESVPLPTLGDNLVYAHIGFVDSAGQLLGSEKLEELLFSQTMLSLRRLQVFPGARNRWGQRGTRFVVDLSFSDIVQPGEAGITVRFKDSNRNYLASSLPNYRDTDGRLAVWVVPALPNVQRRPAAQTIGVRGVELFLPDGALPLNRQSISGELRFYNPRTGQASADRGGPFNIALPQAIYFDPRKEMH